MRIALLSLTGFPMGSDTVSTMEVAADGSVRLRLDATAEPSAEAPAEPLPAFPGETLAGLPAPASLEGEQGGAGRVGADAGGQTGFGLGYLQAQPAGIVAEAGPKAALAAVASDVRAADVWGASDSGLGLHHAPAAGPRVKAGSAAALAIFAANAQLGVLIADWDLDAGGQARPQNKDTACQAYSCTQKCSSSTTSTCWSVQHLIDMLKLRLAKSNSARWCQVSRCIGKRLVQLSSAWHALQVLVHERPDRLVVTYRDMAARGAAAAAPRSTFQAELFTAAGHFQAMGAVRLTWLAVGAPRRPGRRVYWGRRGCCHRDGFY